MLLERKECYFFFLNTGVSSCCLQYSYQAFCDFQLHLSGWALGEDPPYVYGSSSHLLDLVVTNRELFWHVVILIPLCLELEGGWCFKRNISSTAETLQFHFFSPHKYFFFLDGRQVQKWIPLLPQLKGVQRIWMLEFDFICRQHSSRCSALKLTLKDVMKHLYVVHCSWQPSWYGLKQRYADRAAAAEAVSY